jgi:hypothetical protein
VIAQVVDWLGAFRSATTQMLMSKQPMLSTTHTIFRGLQEHIQQIYCNLPMSTSPRIKASLLEAHHKLSDYYYKYDQSLFYTWTASMFSDLHLSQYQKPSHIVPVLDPHISYKGVLQDYAGDPDLLAYLESTKD